MRRYDFIQEASRWKREIYNGTLSRDSMDKMRKSGETIGREGYLDNYARGVHKGALNKIKSMGGRVQFIDDPIRSFVLDPGEKDSPATARIPLYRDHINEFNIKKGSKIYIPKHLAALIADHEANEMKYSKRHGYNDAEVDKISKRTGDDALGNIRLYAKIRGAKTKFGHNPGVLHDEERVRRMMNAATGNYDDISLGTEIFPDGRTVNVNRKKGEREEAKKTPKAAANERIKELNKILDKKNSAKNTAICLSILAGLGITGAAALMYIRKARAKRRKLREKLKQNVENQD